MADIDAKMGQLLTKWRKASGLSQSAIADALGTQQATISKLEAGAYKLNVAQLVTFLNACGLTLADVADEIDRLNNKDDRPLWERINE